MKTLLALTFAVLAAAPAAIAGGGPQYAAVGGPGVASPNGKLHYVAIAAAPPECGIAESRRPTAC